MHEEKDILKKHPLNLHQIITVVVFAVSATFALTKIYDRFETVENRQKANYEAFEAELEAIKNYDKMQFEALHELIEKNYTTLKDDIEKVDGRVTKTTGRLQESLNELATQNE